MKTPQILATPDIPHNCSEQNESETEKSVPPPPPKQPLVFTVVTGIKPARLTKLIGLNAHGGMRKETSAMLSRGHAQCVAVADLNELKSHLDTLTSAQAVTWGVTKDDAVEVCTQTDTRIDSGHTAEGLNQVILANSCLWVVL